MFSYPISTWLELPQKVKILLRESIDAYHFQFLLFEIKSYFDFILNYLIKLCLIYIYIYIYIYKQE